MRKSRFAEEQIIGILKEADAGAQIAELCRRLAITVDPPIPPSNPAESGRNCVWISYP